MADYYPLMAGAVSKLDTNTQEARRTLFERARAILIEQLRARQPPATESEIMRERIALEDAIRRVESAFAGKPDQSGNPSKTQRAQIVAAVSRRLAGGSKGGDYRYRPVVVYGFLGVLAVGGFVGFGIAALLPRTGAPPPLSASGAVTAAANDAAGSFVRGDDAAGRIAAPKAKLNSFGPSSAADRDDRFLEVKHEADIDVYDLSTVQTIQPGRFSVAHTRIAPPDLMKFELKVLDTLRTFCTRADGKYQVPADVFTLGPPDLSVQNIEVESRENFKQVLWSFPYRRLALKFEALAQRSTFFHCRQPNNQSEQQLYLDQRAMLTNGLRSKELFDCKLGLNGFFLHEDDDPAKVIMGFVPQGSVREENYWAVCYRMMQEAPYLHAP